MHLLCDVTSVYISSRIGDYMAYQPMSINAKSGLIDASAAGVATWNDADNAAILATLGGGSKGVAIFADVDSASVLTELGITAFIQTLLDDADAATARATLGANGNLVVEAKSAGFTAAGGKLYEMDSSGGAIAVTLPACDPDVVIGFKLKVAGSNVTLTRAGSDTIDGSNTYVMSIAAEAIYLVGNAAGDRWLVV